MADSGRFVAACVQMRVTDDKERNLAVARSALATAARRGASLAVLPEMFSWRGPADGVREASESLDGPTLRGMADAARQHRLTVVAGSIYERRPDGALPYNTCAVFGPDGSALGVYRKIHLFDVAIPGRVEVRESERMGAGDEVVCLETPKAKLGLSICYDLRFPELYRSLVAREAKVICVPSAFTHATGAAHWEVLLRARAIENQVYVLAPNQVGPTSEGPPVWGGSSIIDPWGVVLARAPENECVITAEIDFDHLEEVRAGLPCLEHARLDHVSEVRRGPR
jgi:predicted amidohydrolase